MGGSVCGMRERVLVESVPLQLQSWRRSAKQRRQAHRPISSSWSYLSQSSSRSTRTCGGRAARAQRVGAPRARRCVPAAVPPPAAVHACTGLRLWVVDQQRKVFVPSRAPAVLHHLQGSASVCQRASAAAERRPPARARLRLGRPADAAARPGPRALACVFRRCLGRTESSTHVRVWPRGRGGEEGMHHSQQGC